MNNYFKPILLLFSFFFFLNSHAQVSDSLSRSDIDFINYAIKDDRYGIYLINKIPAYDLNEVKKYIHKGFFRNGMVDQCGMDISDTIRLSKQDKHSIYKRLKQLKNYKWTLADAKKLNF